MLRTLCSRNLLPTLLVACMVENTISFSVLQMSWASCNTVVAIVFGT